MERSRSKRNYYYEPQDYDSDTVPRTRARYNNTHYPPSNHRHRGNAARPSKPPQDQSPVLTTNYRILCHDIKVGGVIGKSGSIIKSIRQQTGAWINVHELVPGDDERIIEITDTRRRDPDGRLPSFSPAQEALIMIHERTLESDVGAGFNGSKYDSGEEEDEYGAVRGGGGNRVATRLVVSRMHVGCLLGKGGKIIEQMRNETKTQIRVLPRDHNIPRCISMSEEIVQIVGDPNAVKNAVAIIASRLRESQHRDRSHFHGRIQSPERFYSPEDDYISPATNVARRSSMDGPSVRSRLSTNNGRGSNYTARPFDTGASSMVDNMQPFYSEEPMVFRMLCPTDRVESIVGESDGFIELLQDEVGVDVKVADAVASSEEQIIVISSEEGPDDDLFPAQEALLHIQTRIVDIIPDKENIVTTRLVVSSIDIGGLEGRSGSLLEISKMTGADIGILPREELPACVASTDELVQIIGEIKAARDALVEVTSRLRSYMYRELFQKDVNPSPSSVVGKETLSPNNYAGTRQVHSASASASASANESQRQPHLNVQPLSSTQTMKAIGYSGSEPTKQNDSDHTQDVPSSLNRIPVPLVTRSTIEVVIPEHAFPKLLSKSKSKLSQISELSAANVKLIEDQPETTQKTIQISGAPEQVERAQSLLQGFILSTQEDDP